MSITLYAATRTIDEAASEIISPVVPFAHHDATILRPDADTNPSADPFIPNPDYIPGGSATFATGNWYGLIQLITGASDDDSIGKFCTAPLSASRELVFNALCRSTHPYDTNSLLKILNVIDLGISRSASHLEAI